MIYNLFLDDKREIKTIIYNPGDSWIVCKTFQEAVSVVTEKGAPEYMSLDHDLGMLSEGDGFDFVKWLVAQDMERKIDLSNTSFDCHSANPAGKVQILSYLEQYIEERSGNGSFT
jgi:hypothetical protein